jgi:fucose 4-O-acetylase-like acetyltransferase
MSLVDESSVTRGRTAWLDIAKGIGICLVVFGHATNGIVAAGILPPGGATGIVYFIIYTFHMPLFFFLSGITVQRSLDKGYSEFMRGKLVTVAYPYLVWSVIQGVCQLTASDSLNAPFQLAYLLNIPISPIGHFWFLYVLMICHCMAAVARGRADVIFGISLVLLALSPYEPGVLALAGYHLIFYVAGLVAGRQALFAERLNTLMNRNPVMAGTAVTIGFLLVALLAGQWTGYNYASLWVLPATVLGIVSTVLWSHIDPRGHVARVLGYLGQVSLSIYVMHVMACAGTRILLSKVGFSGSPMAYLTICTAAGLLLPVVAHECFSRAGLASALGLRAWRASGPRRAAA